MNKFDIRNESGIDGYRLFENKKDAGEFGEKLYGNWSKNLIDKYQKEILINEKYKLNPLEALKHYSGNAHIGVNSHLRFYYNDSMSDYLKDVIKNVDISFSNVPVLDENIVVFRYISLSEELMSYYFSLEENDIIKDKGYMSTSLIQDIALNDERINSNFALLVIKVPKGERAIFIDAAVGKYLEYEMLINKNRTLKLEKILAKNTKQIVLLCELQK